MPSVPSYQTMESNLTKGKSDTDDVHPGSEYDGLGALDAEPGSGSKHPIQRKDESYRITSGSTTVTTEHQHPTSNVILLDRTGTDQQSRRDEAGANMPNLTDTVRHAAHSARSKLYLHHRHQKDFSKLVTPGTISKHLKMNGHTAARQDTTSNDLEAQLDFQAEHAPTVWDNIKIMCTTFPYWNMAFWSGWCYSIGSALFVIDGAWSWVPIQWPDTEFNGQEKYGVPLLFFFGACLYQVGGVMAYLEAVNDGCFAGPAMKRLLDGDQGLEKALLDAKLHTFFGHVVPHHHQPDHEHESTPRQQSTDINSVGQVAETISSPETVHTEVKEEAVRRGGVDAGVLKKGEISEYLTWQWWPSWHSLRTYHIFELGYIACAIQLFGVTLYGVTSIVILPGIFDTLAWWQELGAYWWPQVVASVCFLVASIMFTIMGQDKWYIPKPRAVSWWIGVHAQIGSVGFLLCAIFGLYSNAHPWAAYQSPLSSLWGSFFYMLSGLFQWYEAINVNVGPVLAFPNNRTPVLLRRQRTEPK